MEKQEIEKIQEKINKLQKYLLTFGGNADSVVMKQYAIKKRIRILKDKIGDNSPTYVLGFDGPIKAR